MRKLTLILAASSALISAPVMAQNVTYACQYIKSGGLLWENKEWKATSFKSDAPFFLSAINNQLTPNSVSKIFGTDVTCLEKEAVSDTQTCATVLADLLIFSFKTMNGGVSHIFGSRSESNQARKDTLSVETFTCTKM
jgi:hypothetical protein